ncbi:MAG: energy-coupling factor ABC transporter permease [Candidatus Eisenbacteria bacterium]
MSHLHIPDGLLPVWVWGAGLLLALLLLVRGSRRARDHSPQRIAYQGALGGLMLAAMAIPLGPLEYHLTLAGPMGVLLGGGGAFQVAFVVSAILALMGHGGLTVVGLNALVLGSGAAVANRVYGAVAHRLRPAPALALGTAAGQAVAGSLWLAMVGFGMRLDPGAAPHAGGGDGRLGVFLGLALPLWIVGIAVESVIAFGLGRFLARVQPGLLPHAPPAAAAREVA